MKCIERYLDIRKKKHEKDNDTTGVIMGLEGISKTTLGLHIFEYWNKINFGDVKKEDIKYIGLTKEDFVKAVAESRINGMPIFDEAGALNNRRTLTKFNTALMEAYQVIRADRLFTLLILPDFFNLDAYFRKHRVKFLICVYSRGRCAFWLREDVMKINALNENRLIKNPWIIKPRFYDQFPKYKGVLKEEYDNLKNKKVSETRKDLPDIFTKKVTRRTIEVPESKVKEIQAKILSKIGFNQIQIGERIGVSTTHVGRLLKREKNLTE